MKPFIAPYQKKRIWKRKNRVHAGYNVNEEGTYSTFCGKPVNLHGLDFEFRDMKRVTCKHCLKRIQTGQQLNFY